MALLYQRVSFSLIDVRRVSSAYIVFLFFLSIVLKRDLRTCSNFCSRLYRIFV